MKSIEVRFYLSLFGLFLSSFAVTSTIFFGYYFWYTFFLVGGILFLDYFNFRMWNHSLLNPIFTGRAKLFLSMFFFVAVPVGIAIDLIYGRIFGNLWYYPHLNAWRKAVFPIFSYYPLGGFLSYEIFYFVCGGSKKWLGKGYLWKLNLNENQKIRIVKIMISILVIGVIIPIINFFVNKNQGGNVIISLFMFWGAFAFDFIHYLYNRKSIFLEIVEGRKHIVFTVIAATLIAALITEVPNTFSWEWIYQNVPFVSLKLFGVNVLILTLGWLFLVMFPTTGYDLARDIYRNFEKNRNFD